MKMVIYVCNGSSDPKCIDAQYVSPSPAVSCAPLTETVSHCPTPSLTQASSVLVQQSSPILTSSAGALVPISSPAVQCQKAAIPDQFFSLFMNQTSLLSAIYNYTSLIPDLELLVHGLNLSSLVLKQVAQNEQHTNTTQNCAIAQNVTRVVESSVFIAPACPLGNYAPGKLLIML
ncbi:hypothetical protein OS493_002828 [Desmophyllum pertusum]|uniref:Uncharacterized protein n=1 Tax=Desmophyllum pertusum TaxID=174260 RepID=A0A9X0CI56_9CNID|nr:hypothetical protein OS493_002828 [Desmophyllum pertusum]